MYSTHVGEEAAAHTAGPATQRQQAGHGLLLRLVSFKGALQAGALGLLRQRCPRAPQPCYKLLHTTASMLSGGPGSKCQACNKPLAWTVGHPKPWNLNP